MSKIKNGGLDQYGTGPFEQQQFATVEGVKPTTACNRMQYILYILHSKLPKNDDTSAG